MMKKLRIPNHGEITIENVIFDINGTIQFKGALYKDLKVKFAQLKEIYNVYLISSDTRGNLRDLAKELGVKHVKVSEQSISDTEAKNNELNKLGKERTVAIGNGNNDSLMLKNAVLGLAVIGSEGATKKCLMNSDVIFPDPISAIDFLLDDNIMIATLRS